MLNWTIIRYFYIKILREGNLW